jgi:hypothetical protein
MSSELLIGTPPQHAKTGRAGDPASPQHAKTGRAGDPAQELQGGAYGERRLVQLRSSLGPVGEGLGFRIDAAGAFCWTGPAESDAHELLAAPPRAEQESALAQAIEFLRAGLQEHDALTYGEIQKMARQAGISQASLQRAKYRLGVVCRKQQGSGCWYWSLAKQVSEVSEVVLRRLPASETSNIPTAAKTAGNMGRCGAAEAAPFRCGHRKPETLDEDGAVVEESVEQVAQVEKVEQVDAVSGEWPAAVPWVMMGGAAGSRSPAVPGRGG